MRHLNRDFQNQVWNSAIKWLVKYPQRLKLWTLNQSHFIRRLCSKMLRPGCSQNILCCIQDFLLWLKINFINFSYDSILILINLRTIQNHPYKRYKRCATINSFLNSLDIWQLFPFMKCIKIDFRFRFIENAIAHVIVTYKYK